MNKILLSLFVLLTINISVKALNVNIPDANFKAYLVGNAAINTNGDTEIQVSEASAFTGAVDIYDDSISDLTGIEQFTNITKLYCFDNLLSSLNVTQNTALTLLNCSGNLLNSLDLTQNTALIELFCNNNTLSSLDLTHNTALNRVYCNYNSLSSIDLSQNTALTEFSCNNNSLSSLDVLQNMALTKLDCSVNSLSSLNVAPNTALIELKCNNNLLSSLDVSQNTALKTLNCNSNSLSSLDVTLNTALTTLYCGINSLSSIDVSQNTALVYFTCSSNLLTSIDVSQNTALSHLNCFLNSLGSLDVTQNTALTILNCKSSSISSLDVSQNPDLTHLYCEDNAISSLDLSNNPVLYSFWCHDNLLNSLNIANGNNSNIYPDGFGFNATGNPNLFCIQIDAGFTVPNFWSEDPIVSYSDDCDLSCLISIPDLNFKNYLVGNAAINTNGDTEIQCSEAATFTGSINCANLSISDLTGIEAFTVLTSLSCNDNSLSSLDISQNTALTYLLCNGNSLSSLAIAQNTALTDLYCAYNLLNSLDVSNNTALTTINCDNNLITSLDVSNNNALTSLVCNNNSLVNLNIANGNNPNFRIDSYGLNAEGNANLTCIQIDAGFTPSVAWQKDPMASYSSNDCPVLVSSIIVQGQGGVSIIATNGGTLQMEATVLPANVVDATYTWSVANGTGSATISATGLLTASAVGTVEVKATANDASGTVGTKLITISNQTVGINNLAFESLHVYPNPVIDKINLITSEALIPIAFETIKIFDLTGKKIKVFSPENSVLDVSELNTGLYFLELVNGDNKAIIKIVKK